jgi:hypothetical protein
LPRTKLEPQYVCVIVYICVAIDDQVMKRGQLWGYQRFNTAYCCASSKSGLYFQRYGRFAVGSCILILLDKCMLWWFHVEINTDYVRYRSQHISDDGMYCMWLITMSIYNVFLYFYIFCLCLHIPRLVYVSVCTMQKVRMYLFNRRRRKILMFMITTM